MLTLTSTACLGLLSLGSSSAIWVHPCRLPRVDQGSAGAPTLRSPLSPACCAALPASGVCRASLGWRSAEGWRERERHAAIRGAWEVQNCVHRAASGRQARMFMIVCTPVYPLRAPPAASREPLRKLWFLIDTVGRPPARRAVQVGAAAVASLAGGRWLGPRPTQVAEPASEDEPSTSRWCGVELTAEQWDPLDLSSTLLKVR